MIPEFVRHYQNNVWRIKQANNEINSSELVFFFQYKILIQLSILIRKFALNIGMAFDRDLIKPYPLLAQFVNQIL